MAIVAPARVLDGAIAAELLRQRIGGSGARPNSRAVPYSMTVESPHRARPAALEPHREILDHLVSRAYSQLIDGDAAAARRTLEHALGMGEPFPIGSRAAVITLASASVRVAPAAGSVSPASPAPVQRVVVRTLGTFEVLVDGAARPEGKKQPRRTLALLKAIIALGGKDVCRSHIGRHALA